MQAFTFATVVHENVVVFVNVAVTERAVVIDTTHAPVPVHAPAQPANTEPVVAVGVSVTLVLKLKLAEHVAPQLMPAGIEATEPAPVPFFATVSTCCVSVKLAVTAFASVIGTVQAPVPEHAPDQPVNVEPVVATGDSETIVPESKLNVHVAPHEMPAGVDVTVPAPLEAFVIVSAYFLRLNAAVIAAALSVVTAHGAVPEQPPFAQPAKTDSTAAVAVSVTCWPGPYCSLQSPGQLMPAGADATPPVPVPVIVTTIEFASANVGAMVTSAEAVTTQSPTPGQLSLPQPINVEPGAGVAVNVIAVPSTKGSLQSVPQSMPAGFDVTVPVPLPVIEIVIVRFVGGAASGELLAT